MLAISPHTSYLDPVLLFGALPRPSRFIADSYFVFSNALISWFLWAAGVVPVNRIKPDPFALRQYLRLLAQGELCVLFPEGARSMTADPIPPMPAAAKLIAKLRVPAAVVAVEGAFDAWPRWDRKLRLWSGPLIVRFSELLVPSIGTPPMQTCHSLDTVIDRRKRVNVALAQNSLQETLRRAARKEPTSINLLRPGRPEALERLLCFCPECAQPQRIRWNDATGCLICGGCGLRLRVQEHGLSIGDESLTLSLHEWAVKMEGAIIKKDPTLLYLAVQTRCRLNGLRSPVQACSLRIDRFGFGLRCASGETIMIKLQDAIRGSSKGNTILEIPHKERLIIMESPDGHAVTWLILIRKLAGLKSFFEAR